ncbi:MAG: hypothetical protein WA705_03400, partial [Candidatus Ozemobacteraceae bacterium]
STVPTRDGKSDGFLLDYWTDSFRNGGRITLGTSDEFSRNTQAGLIELKNSPGSAPEITINNVPDNPTVTTVNETITPFKISP